ncbi:hypothetical protein O181_047402 [Austropuccinia psidii MF-1]|uniref:Uncharacterized protein n=1 Tax=Austropuccinia psidii MF-1 TaxID=1389203 RepID=A0A9Q3HKL3_9BASI|nr:hypothetical protein [Austropuccinia psidii MF-1]
MPFQHLLPEIPTRSHSRTQAILTPTPRVHLDGTPAGPQMGAHLERGPFMEGKQQSRKEEGQKDQIPCQG